jgi:hypothetical protein
LLGLAMTVSVWNPTVFPPSLKALLKVKFLEKRFQYLSMDVLAH